MASCGIRTLGIAAVVTRWTVCRKGLPQLEASKGDICSFIREITEVCALLASRDSGSARCFRRIAAGDEAPSGACITSTRLRLGDRLESRTLSWPIWIWGGPRAAVGGVREAGGAGVDTGAGGVRSSVNLVSTSLTARKHSARICSHMFCELRPTSAKMERLLSWRDVARKSSSQKARD